MANPQLTPEERNDVLPPLRERGWTEVEGRDAIHKTYVFKDFNEAFGFMSRVALRAEEKGHHPEWFNVWNRVEVTWSTHDASGLTRLDVDMANWMDHLLPTHSDLT